MSGRAARTEWLHAKDHAKRVIAALRADGARLKKSVRADLVMARNTYRVTVAHLKDRLRQWKTESSYQIDAERTNVRRLRDAVEAHVTTGQRAAGQRLNERFHEAMGAAEHAIGHMHPELVPSFRRWNNSAEARRAFSRAVKKLGQRRGVRANAIGDAVAIEFMESHVASYSDAMQHANETVEQCMQRAEKRIAQLQLTDPYEYEQEAARIWHECSARAS